MPPQRFKLTLHSSHARTQTRDKQGTRERASSCEGKEEQTLHRPAQPGPAPTCRPRARGRRRRRPVLAKDEFEVEVVVGATVCSSHRRGPGCCGSSSRGGGDGGDSSSAPLHAGPRRPGGRGSATNFPGGDHDTKRSVPNSRAGRAANLTKSHRHCQSLVPKPTQWP